MTEPSMERPPARFRAEMDGALLDGAERDGLARAGYGSGPAVRMQRPVLVVVDVTWGFCGRERDADLATSVERYPLASGRAAWDAVPRIAQLVAAARDTGLPIVFTRPASPAESAPGRVRWEDKNRRHRDVPVDAFELVPDINASPGDPVLVKEAPSAFFATSLRRWLTRWDADGVVLCGGTTSGCVRATAVDAFSHELLVTVAADATFDRISVSHRVSLFDLELKYAEVSAVTDIVDAWEETGLASTTRSPDVRGERAPPTGGGEPMLT